MAKGEHRFGFSGHGVNVDFGGHLYKRRVDWRRCPRAGEAETPRGAVVYARSRGRATCLGRTAARAAHIQSLPSAHSLCALLMLRCRTGTAEKLLMLSRSKLVAVRRTAAQARLRSLPKL